MGFDMRHPLRYQTANDALSPIYGARSPGRPGDVIRPLKKSTLRRVVNRLLNVAARLSPGATTLRPMLHRARGVKIGRGVFIGDDVYIDGEFPEVIEIHDGAAISIRAMIIAHNKGPGSVVIGRDAFIGPQAVVICSGGKLLRIGEGAVIGAGCVVSRNVAPRSVVVPAPTQLVGHAAVSLAAAKTIEEFWAGLKPARGGAPSGGMFRPPSDALPSTSDKR